ncbi:MAG TPA: YetF domain-containing protein [Gammaproteobacteria bacterium]
MDPVFRALAVYFFLLLVFRIIGKRSLSQITSFDFLLLLIVGEATQQALLGQDYSITNALLVIMVLVGVDYLLAMLKERSRAVERILEGAPLIVVANGKVLETRIKRAGLDEDDVLKAARLKHGLERMEQIKYAIQERDGNISIIPYSTERDPA